MAPDSARHPAVDQHEAEIRLIMDNVPALLAYINRDETYRRVNRTYTEWLGLDPSQIVGRTIGDVIGEPHRTNLRPWLARALAGEKVHYESQLRAKDGQLRDISVDYTPDLAPDGTVRGFFTLVQDITERKRAQQALEEFAYAAAHDLQEPLRTLSVYCQLLERRHAGELSEGAREYLGYAINGARRMQELVSDLLAYTRVASDAASVHEVDCVVVLDRVLENLDSAIRESGAMIVRGELPTVCAHQARIFQLLQNLISNAIKYRQADVAPHVRISADPFGQWWRFAVADNGCGIEPQHRERVFGVFKRLHGKEVPGTGIGLAICRRIVQVYGGSIWVESAGAGQGSTFYFTLPASSAIKE